MQRLLLSSLFLVILTSTRMVVHAFVIPYHQQQFSSVSIVEGAATITTSLHASTDAIATTELWLDLRGTKLTPSEASERLEQDLMCRGFVDRFLVDTTPTNPATATPSTTTNTLRHDNDNNIIFVQNDKFIQGLEHGGLVLTIPALSGIVLDPMPAVDAVQRGEWVLLIEPELSGGESQKRRDGISSLVQLLSGCVIPSMNNGNFATQATGSISGSGGIAWCCTTKADILHAGMVVQSLEYVESTRGGILLTSSAQDSKTSSSDRTTPLQRALMLPFDQVLWQTALKFFRESTDNYDTTTEEADDEAIFKV
jgi:hypothetical protein